MSDVRRLHSLGAKELRLGPDWGLSLDTAPTVHQKDKTLTAGSGAGGTPPGREGLVPCSRRAPLEGPNVCGACPRPRLLLAGCVLWAGSSSTGTREVVVRCPGARRCSQWLCGERRLVKKRGLKDPHHRPFC